MKKEEIYTLQNPSIQPVKVVVEAGFSTLDNLVEQQLSIVVKYPEHGKRISSSLYRKNRKELIIEEDIPCFICGISYSRGGSMEAHHFFVEWAATNAIDWKIFGEYADGFFANPQTGESINSAGFDWDFVSENPEVFIDSRRNLLVLCQEHHRAPQVGIHCTPYPIWILQKWPTKNFIFIPRGDIDKNHS